jgi:pilus assembly protein Flp/PilA
MMNQINNFLRNEEGASAVEYGLIVGLIAVVIVSVLITSGQSLNTLFGNISTALSGAAGG